MWDSEGYFSDNARAMSRVVRGMPSREVASALLRQVIRRSTPSSRLIPSLAPPRTPPPPQNAEETAGRDEVVAIATATMRAAIDPATEAACNPLPPPPLEPPPAAEGAFGLLEALPTELLQRILGSISGEARDHARQSCTALKVLVDHTPAAAGDELGRAWTRLPSALFPRSWLLWRWRRPPPLALASITTVVEVRRAVERIDELRRRSTDDRLADGSSSLIWLGHLARRLWRRRSTPTAGGRADSGVCAELVCGCAARSNEGASILSALQAVFVRWAGDDEAWASTLTLTGREALQGFVAEACRARYATTATLVLMRHPPMPPDSARTRHELLVLGTTAHTPSAAGASMRSSNAALTATRKPRWRRCESR